VGVAILQDPFGGPPRIATTDRKHDKAVYAFSLQDGFSQIVHTRDITLNYTTPPVQLPDGSTVVGTDKGVLTKTLLNLLEGPSIPGGFGTLTAAPTRHRDGSIVVVSREGSVTKYGNGFWRTALGGQSIASAAASCTHVFVTARNGFYTYDAGTMQQVAEYSWINHGGLSSPVIGPQGQVYAIVDQYLFVFKGPPTTTSNGCSTFPTTP